MSLTIFSYGGGVQSTAALVLAARGELNCSIFLFCNVGEDSEHPDTLRYVFEIAMPYAKAHGLNLIELHRIKRNGERETLYGRLTRPDSKFIGIPVRLAGSGMPANRNCTADFKARLTAKWCREHGATRAHPAITMLGISLDEFQRMRNDSGIPYTRLAYPLIDRRLTRQDCRNIIASAGLPIPPKSSCWFCPFHTVRAWRDLRDTRPDLFRKACELEALLTARAKMLKRSPRRGALPPEREAVFMSGRLKPLAQVVGDAVQPSLFEGDACESGYCMV